MNPLKQVFPVLPLDVRVRNVGGTIRVSRRDKVFELGGASSEIWRAIDGRRSVWDIGVLIGAAYDEDPGMVAADVNELVQTLAAADIVALTAAP